MRPMCKQCNIRVKSINYVKDEKTYYRSCCDTCMRQKKIAKSIQQTRWQRAGYKKKPRCEHCGFFPAYHDQLIVFHVDQNLSNVKAQNLRTICLNCNHELNLTGWTRGDLLED